MSDLFESQKNNTRRRLWGRSLSRPLSPKQQNIYERGLQEFLYKAEDNNFWKTYDNYTLEVGFGDGEHLVAMAQNNPKTGFIGCERFINGLAKAFEDVYTHDIKNARFFPDDAHLILPHFPKNSFSSIYVLFPDPWPKKRHKKRRILNQNFMMLCHSLLKNNGTFYMASDIEDYRDFIQEEMQALPHHFKHIDTTSAPLTKYCRKAEKAGRKSYMLVYEKIDNHENSNSL